MAVVFRNRPRVLTRTLSGLLVALMVGSVGAGYTATMFLDAVLADVNGMTITASDATIARALGLFGIRQSENPIQAADVKQLVDAWLIEAEAARLQIEPSPAEVEEAWKAAAARVGGELRHHQSQRHCCPERQLYSSWKRGMRLDHYAHFQREQQSGCDELPAFVHARGTGGHAFARL